MAKKALLIGINYPGTAVELRGCVNDVRRMQKCLIERYGFSNGDITILIDTDKSYIQPTGKNIRDKLEDLIKAGKSGDILVFHYSGHGTRLPPVNEESGDSTGYDECITPCDMNLIKDDDFRQMVAKVEKGCQLTIISDSCHSGGLIEEVKEQIGESHVKPIEENHENPPTLGIANYLLSIFMSFFAACGISKTQRDGGGALESFTGGETESEREETFEVKTRYIPFHIYVSLLKQQTGETDIKSGRIRQTLAKLFGEDSSMSGDRGLRDIGNCEVNAVNSQGTKEFANNGILLSGCQTYEKSEDVYVTRTGKAYGAFSDAIQTILSETRKEKKITNKKLVIRAREILKRHRFSQRPGLYCHDRYVNKPFIC
ncbi:hypothetical protein CARUB_v10011040mg [Capsella rubella]|uniref:Peptidase C14 caspase domain-containing protein n=1 Tax=Capsella rubella TaxID=81985 RepID=R0GN02_9BRAS|nr:metacaspase-8 [Capsella rubella]EOA37332.1 hypothetical protein CARUB_v10011040mg [Capsella rubella]